MELYGQVLEQREIVTKSGQRALHLKLQNFDGQVQERNIPYIERSLQGTVCLKNDEQELEFQPLSEVAVMGRVSSSLTSTVMADTLKLTPAQTEFTNRHLHELCFVKMYQDGKAYVAQIAALDRPAAGGLRINAIVIGQLPPTPFYIGTPLLPATEQEVYERMNIQVQDAIFIGKISNTNIRAFAPIFKCENGLVILGEKNSGKTYSMRVLAEGVAEINRAVLLYDFYGDLIFKFKAEQTARHEQFGIKPKSFKNTYISIGSTDANPFTDAYVENGDISTLLRSEKFYTDFIRRGEITTLSFKGVTSLTEKQKHCATIANMLNKLGNENKLPKMMFGLDEAYHFAREGKKKETIVSHDPLMYLSTYAGHIDVMPVFISQRHAFISKDLTGTNPAFLSHKLQLRQDTERLPRGMDAFRHLLNSLQTGRVVVQGIFPFTTMVDIRPAYTRHFRDVKQIHDFLEQDCKGVYERDASIQARIDSIVEGESVGRENESGKNRRPPRSGGRRVEGGDEEIDVP